MAENRRGRANMGGQLPMHGDAPSGWRVYLDGGPCNGKRLLPHGYSGRFELIFCKPVTEDSMGVEAVYRRVPDSVGGLPLFRFVDLIEIAE